MKYFLSCVFVLLLTNNLFGQGNTTGLIPINDLKTGLYKGYQGGLYPNGLNERPFKHDSLGLEFSKQIKPFDAQGNVNLTNGKYVLLSIGMSNTTQEFSVFKSTADKDPDKNSQLVIVDGAQGGQTALIISNSSAAFWSNIDQRLQSAGVTSKQVQICWVKEADAGPTQAFPIHTNTLLKEFILIAKTLKQKYPNCIIAYWSSRTYGGYATTNLNPEPYAYESAFSVKWLIEKQITGDSNLICTGLNSNSPWLAWSPYLWADGTNARSDGLTWNIDDFVTSDRTHPSASGQKKVSDLLLNFFKTDATAKKWFVKNSATDIEQNLSSQLPVYYKLEQNYPNPFNPVTVIGYQLSVAGYVSLKVYDLLGREVATLVNEYKPKGSYIETFHGTSLPSGTYFYKIQFKDFAQTKKIILIK